MIQRLLFRSLVLQIATLSFLLVDESRGTCWYDVSIGPCCSPIWNQVNCGDNPLYPCVTIEVSCPNERVCFSSEIIDREDTAPEECLAVHISRSCVPVWIPPSSYLCVTVNAWGVMDYSCVAAGPECVEVE